MIKKSFILALLLFILSLSTTSIVKPVYAGKFGINIAGHFSEFNRAVELVGESGWITVAADPLDSGMMNELTNFIQIAQGKSINLIVRGHFPGKPLTTDRAKAWADYFKSRSNIITNVIYFIPINEPNNPQENVTFQQANTYMIAILKEFNNAGIRAKVRLLAPALDIYKFADNGLPTGYKTAWNGAFFEQFDGIPLHLYGQMNSNGTMDAGASPMKLGNPDAVLTALGITKKMDIVIPETGVLCLGCEGKNMVIYPYTQQYKNMIQTYFSSVADRWGQSDVKGFTILSYSPEQGQANWIDNKAIANSFADFVIAAVGGGTPPVRSDGSGTGEPESTPVPTATPTPVVLQEDTKLFYTRVKQQLVPASLQQAKNSEQGFFASLFGTDAEPDKTSVLIPSSKLSSRQAESADEGVLTDVGKLIGDLFGQLFSWATDTDSGYAHTLLPSAMGDLPAQSDDSNEDLEKVHERLINLDNEEGKEKGVLLPAYFQK